MKRSIIIPAYNEARRIATTLASISAYLELPAAQSSEWEVIVVCDGCHDATEQEASAFAARLPLRVLSYPLNRGKGYAVRKGVSVSTGHLVAFMDADGSTPVCELDRLSRPIQQGQADIVVGSRRTPDARVRVGQSVLRRWLGRAFACHAQLVLGLGVHDTQCGFKVFRGSVARTLFAELRCDGFAFDLELLAFARGRNLRVLERGVQWRESPGSTVRPLRDGVQMLRAAWQIRARQRAFNRGMAKAADALVPAPLCKGVA
jgi:dolichyl-phosphate beta-glucosyltransferase